MEVPITQFRQEIFALVNRALEGETVTLSYKGKRLRLVPEDSPATRFDRLTSLQVIADGPVQMDDSAMKSEMQREWEQDWKDQGLA